MNVLEGYVNSLILRYGNEFIQDLPDLKLSVWSGEVVLRNLQLKLNVLEQLFPTIHFVLGEIKVLHLSIPWTSLNSTPIHITLDNFTLFAIVKEGGEEVYQPEENRHEYTIVDTNDSSWSNWMFRKILDNVAVTINNFQLKIQYNNSVATICMDKITVNSVNDFWENSFIDAPNFWRKICKIRKLSVFVNKLENQIEIEKKGILHNINFTTRMFLNRDQDNASDDNRFDIISDSVIMVDIDISQYQFLIELFFVIKKNISNISSRKSRTVLNKQRGWGYYLNPFASTEEVNSDVATNYKTFISFFASEFFVNILRENGPTDLLNIVGNKMGFEVELNSITADMSLKLGIFYVKVTTNLNGNLAQPFTIFDCNPVHIEAYSKLKFLSYTLYDVRVPALASESKLKAKWSIFETFQMHFSSSVSDTYPPTLLSQVELQVSPTVVALHLNLVDEMINFLSIPITPKSSEVSLSHMKSAPILFSIWCGKSKVIIYDVNKEKEESNLEFGAKSYVYFYHNEANISNTTANETSIIRCKGNHVLVGVGVHNFANDVFLEKLISGGESQSEFIIEIPPIQSTIQLKLSILNLNFHLNSNDFLLMYCLIPDFIDENIKRAMITDWFNQEFGHNSEQLEKGFICAKNFSFTLFSSLDTLSIDIKLSSGNVRYQSDDYILSKNGESEIQIHYQDIKTHNIVGKNKLLMKVDNTEFYYNHNWLCEWIYPLFFSSKLSTGVTEHPLSFAVAFLQSTLIQMEFKSVYVRVLLENNNYLLLEIDECNFLNNNQSKDDNYVQLTQSSLYFYDNRIQRTIIIFPSLSFQFIYSNLLLLPNQQNNYECKLVFLPLNIQIDISFLQNCLYLVTELNTLWKTNLKTRGLQNQVITNHFNNLQNSTSVVEPIFPKILNILLRNSIAISFSLIFSEFSMHYKEHTLNLVNSTFLFSNTNQLIENQREYTGMFSIEKLSVIDGAYGESLLSNGSDSKYFFSTATHLRLSSINNQYSVLQNTTADFQTIDFLLHMPSIIRLYYNINHVLELFTKRIEKIESKVIYEVSNPELLLVNNFSVKTALLNVKLPLQVKRSYMLFTIADSVINSVIQLDHQDIDIKFNILLNYLDDNLIKTLILSPLDLDLTIKHDNKSTSHFTINIPDIHYNVNHSILPKILYDSYVYLYYIQYLQQVIDYYERELPKEMENIKNQFLIFETSININSIELNYQGKQNDSIKLQAKEFNFFLHSGDYPRMDMILKNISMTNYCQGKAIELMKVENIDGDYALAVTTSNEAIIFKFNSFIFDIDDALFQELAPLITVFSNVTLTPHSLQIKGLENVKGRLKKQVIKDHTNTLPQIVSIPKIQFNLRNSSNGEYFVIDFGEVNVLNSVAELSIEIRTLQSTYVISSNELIPLFTPPIEIYLYSNIFGDPSLIGRDRNLEAKNLLIEIPNITVQFPIFYLNNLQKFLSAFTHLNQQESAIYSLESNLLLQREPQIIRYDSLAREPFIVEKLYDTRPPLANTITLSNTSSKEIQYVWMSWRYRELRVIEKVFLKPHTFPNTINCTFQLQYFDIIQNNYIVVTTIPLSLGVQADFVEICKMNVNEYSTTAYEWRVVLFSTSVPPVLLPHLLDFHSAYIPLYNYSIVVRFINKSGSIGLLHNLAVNRDYEGKFNANREKEEVSLMSISWSDFDSRFAMWDHKCQLNIKQYLGIDYLDLHYLTTQWAIPPVETSISFQSKRQKSQDVIDAIFQFPNPIDVNLSKSLIQTAVILSQSLSILPKKNVSSAKYVVENYTVNSLAIYQMIEDCQISSPVSIVPEKSVQNLYLSHVFPNPEAIQIQIFNIIPITRTLDNKYLNLSSDGWQCVNLSLMHPLRDSVHETSIPLWIFISRQHKEIKIKVFGSCVVFNSFDRMLNFNFGVDDINLHQFLPTNIDVNYEENLNTNVENTIAQSITGFFLNDRSSIQLSVAEKSQNWSEAIPLNYSESIFRSLVINLLTKNDVDDTNLSIIFHQIPPNNSPLLLLFTPLSYISNTTGFPIYSFNSFDQSQKKTSIFINSSFDRKLITVPYSPQSLLLSDEMDISLTGCNDPKIEKIQHKIPTGKLIAPYLSLISDRVANNEENIHQHLNSILENLVTQSDVKSSFSFAPFHQTISTEDEAKLLFEADILYSQSVDQHFQMRVTILLIHMQTIPTFHILYHLPIRVNNQSDFNLTFFEKFNNISENFIRVLPKKSIVPFEFYYTSPSSKQIISSPVLLLPTKDSLEFQIGLSPIQDTHKLLISKFEDMHTFTIFGKSHWSLMFQFEKLIGKQQIITIRDSNQFIYYFSIQIIVHTPFPLSYPHSKNSFNFINNIEILITPGCFITNSTPYSFSLYPLSLKENQIVSSNKNIIQDDQNNLISEIKLLSGETSFISGPFSPNIEYVIDRIRLIPNHLSYSEKIEKLNDNSIGDLTSPFNSFQLFSTINPLIKATSNQSNNKIESKEFLIFQKENSFNEFQSVYYFNFKYMEETNAHFNALFYLNPFPPYIFNNNSSLYSITCFPVINNEINQNEAFHIPSNSSISHTLNTNELNISIYKENVFQKNFIITLGKATNLNTYIQMDEKGFCHSILTDIKITSCSTVITSFDDFISSNLEVKNTQQKFKFNSVITMKQLNLIIIDQNNLNDYSSKYENYHPFPYHLKWKEILCLSFQNISLNYSFFTNNISSKSTNFSHSLVCVIHNYYLEHLNEKSEYSMVLFPLPNDDVVIKDEKTLPKSIDFVIVFSQFGLISLFENFSLKLSPFSINVDDAFISSVVHLSSSILPLFSLFSNNISSSDPLTKFSILPFYYSSFNLDQFKNYSIISILEDKQKELFEILNQKFIYFFHISEICFEISLKINIHIYLSFENSPVTLSKLEYKKFLTTPINFSKLITEKYVLESVYQTPSLIGSLEMFGNPTFVLHNFKKAVKQLIYYPLSAQSTTGVLFGLGKGISSFFKFTSQSTLQSVSGITSSVARNIEKLSFNNEYLQYKKNELSLNSNQVSETIAHGVKGFGVGILSGLSGMVSNPITGAASGGFTGLLSGVGKGLLGAVTIPISGTMDLISYTSRGILRTISTDLKILRRREIRFPVESYLISGNSIVKYLETYLGFNESVYYCCSVFMHSTGNPAKWLNYLIISQKTIYLFDCEQFNQSILTTSPFDYNSFSKIQSITTLSPLLFKIYINDENYVILESKDIISFDRTLTLLQLFK